MSTNKFLSELKPLWTHVRDTEFCSTDVPKQYRKILASLCSDGYLISVGKRRVQFSSGRYVYLAEYRIARRYLNLLESGEW